MSDDMRITNITIHNFKSLYDISFEPGNVNVLIGANGSGKSSVLEAIGTLSAAMTDRVNSNSLQRKGVRLSTAQLYKSKFLDIKKEFDTRCGMNIYQLFRDEISQRIFAESSK